MQGKIGIMGGTFDPIHVGHLITAEVVRADFGLDEILFIPAGIPPHKESQKLAKATDRLAMTEIAVAGNPHFRVTDIELKRQGKSYTIDTIEELQRQLGYGVKLYFITGADAMNDLYSWHRPQELLHLCEFIVVTRQGVEFDQLGLVRNFDELARRRVHQLPTPRL